MKKLFLALLVVLLAIFLTACGEDDHEEVLPEEPPVETPAPTPEPDVDEEEEIVPFVPTGFMGIGEAARNMTRAEIISFIPDFTPQGEIVLGSWDSAATDARVGELVGGHFLATMASNMDREFFPNPMVTREIDIRDNADGSRTYTFTIYTENRFSDGTFIDASHYVADIALFSGIYEIVGHEDWVTGEADTLAGVRLYDDQTFSVTIDAQWLPFIWENITYMMWTPTPLHIIAPGAAIADNGDGVFVEGLAVPIIDIAPTLTVGAGPYRLVSSDTASSRITLKVNPYFAGTWDGYAPRIQTIIISQMDRSALVDAVVAGEVDMLSGLGGGDAINAAFARLEGTTHDAVDYPRHGYNLLRFHVDHGPTQFASVRQAISWMVDRDMLVEELMQGHGAIVQGPYSLSMWWYPYALQRGFYNRIIHYNFNPDRAIEVLEANGWVLNSAGEPFELGVDTVRYKDVSIYTELAWFGGYGVSDPSINADGLMRLEIRWARPADGVHDHLNNQLTRDLASIGMLLTTVPTENIPLRISRAGGAAPEFHMFDLGYNLGLAYSPWEQLNPDPAFLGSHNTTFNRDKNLFALANDLRTMSIDDVYDRMDFVDAWAELMIELNHQAIEIPLFADIYYCFIPHRLQDWRMNSTWNFSEAIVRAYVTQ